MTLHPTPASATVDRRQLLKGLGLAGGGVLASGLSGVPTAFAAPTGESSRLTPFDLHFTVDEQYRPFDLVDPGFVQHEEAGTTLRSPVRTEVGPRAPYAAVLVDVTSLPGDGGVAAGLTAENGDSVLTTYDAGAGRVAVEVTRNGETSVTEQAAASLEAPFRFAFVVNENFVVALADTGSGWTPLLRHRVDALVDLRDPETLRRYTYGYGPRGDGGAIVLGGVRAGYFGQAGVRDPHLVTCADGTPYIRDGKAYLTLTQAGLGFFQAAHWGVWTLDLDDPTRLEQVANIFAERDGLVLGDHAGHIVYDEDSGEFIVAMSGWGDFAFQGVGVHYTRTTENVLSGVHVLPTRPMPLPTDVSAWDPAITRINGRWQVAFVESPSQDPFRFHPALASGRPGGDLDELTLVGADTSLDQTEGTIVQKIGGQWYLLASDGDARQYRVYDLNMQLLGRLEAPYGSNIPHPMIIPVPEAGRTRYVMVTFNGTQFEESALGYGTHGDFIVMSAPQTRHGHEFPPRG